MMRDTVSPKTAGDDYGCFDTQSPHVVAGTHTAGAHTSRDTPGLTGGGTQSPTTRGRPISTPEASSGTPCSHADHSLRDTYTRTVGVAPDSIPDQGSTDTQEDHVGDALNSTGDTGGDSHPGPPKTPAAPKAASRGLDDSVLTLASAVLDDLESVRIANENRLRQLTRSVEDKDGQDRGFGLSIHNPDVLALAGIVAAMNCKSEVLNDLGWVRPAKQRGKPCCLEHSAESNLAALMKRHPLGPWVTRMKGVGDKQAARLLAAVGDPYWNYLYDRPRLVSELWSYCGYGDAEKQVRRKGVKSNWSNDAKKRVHLIAKKCVLQLSKPCYSVKGDDGLVIHTVHAEGECVCGGYRLLYDERKAHYAGSVHPRECVRCTGNGEPAAPVGSLRKAAHVDSLALRAVKKEILRDMWSVMQNPP
jgi:hypothetical protein